MNRELKLHPLRLAIAFGMAAGIATTASIGLEYNNIRKTSEKLSYTLIEATGRSPDEGEVCAIKSIAKLQAEFAIKSTYALPLTSYAQEILGGFNDYLNRANARLELNRQKNDFLYIINTKKASYACGISPDPSITIT